MILTSPFLAQKDICKFGSNFISMISTCITVMAGRLPDAPFALELVQLESVGVCMQLSGGDRHHHHDQYKDLRYHLLSL